MAVIHRKLPRSQRGNMQRTLSVIILLVSTTFAHAMDKPVIYDHITKAGASIDQMVNSALEARYTILPVEDSPAYVDVKVAAGGMPQSAKTASGEILKGYVLIAYVITADGRADNPVVLKTTEKRLNLIATNAMKDWRFAPARLNGVPIALAAAQEFYFGEDIPKGFETSNVVLYQVNDILEKRVPSAQQLADYIKKLQGILSDYFAEDTSPEAFDTVVALRPGKIVGVWFVSSKRSGRAKEFDALRRKLEAVEPIDVQGGPVAFAISGKLAGGDSTNTQGKKDFVPPLPKEWQDAAALLKPSSPIQFDDYLNVVWPAKK
jgi:hypothetical protein